MSCLARISALFVGVCLAFVCPRPSNAQLPSFASEVMNLSWKGQSLWDRFRAGSDERRALTSAIQKKVLEAQKTPNLAKRLQIQTEIDELTAQANQIRIEEQKALQTEVGQLLTESIQQIGKFYPALKAEVVKLQGPSRKELQELRERLKNYIEESSTTSDQADQILKERDRYSLEEGSFDVRESMQFEMAYGFTETSVELFELNAARCRLFADMIALRIMEKKLKGDFLSWNHFDSIRQAVDLAVQDTRTLFPDLPILRRSALRRNGNMSEPLDSEKVKAFVQSFASVRGTFSDPSVPNRIQNALAAMEEGVRKAERFRIESYPKLDNDEQHRDLMEALFEVPGIDECIALAKGLATFQGGPCHPEAFRKALEAYLEFFGKWGSDGTLSLLSEAIEPFEDKELTDAEWKTLQTEIRQLPFVQSTISEVGSRWDRVANDLVGDKSPLRQLLRPDVRGSIRYMFLQQVLFHHKIGWNLQDGQWKVKGGREDWTPAVAEMKNLAASTQERFDQEVKGFFEGSTLGTYPESFTRLDGNFESCRIFGASYVKDPAIKSELANKTEAQLIQESPWVIQSEGIEDQRPVTVPTSNGHVKLLWYHKAKPANAYQIQIVQNAGRKHLAGILAFTRRKMILPNILFTMQLMPKYANKDVRKIGLNFERPSLIREVDDAYHLPSEETIYAEAEMANRAAKKRYALNKTHMLPPLKEVVEKMRLKLNFPRPLAQNLQAEEDEEQDPPAGLSEEQKAELDKAVKEEIERLFREMRDNIERQFRSDYRADMLKAAKRLKEIDKRIATLRADFEKNGPGIISRVLGDKAAAFTEEPHVPGAEQGLKNSTLYMIDGLKEFYINKHFPKADDRQKANLRKKLMLSPEAFVEMFKLRGWYYVGAHNHKMIAHGLNSPTGQPMTLELLRFYEAALNGYYRQAASLEFTHDYLLYKFPALKQTDFFFNYVYTTYSDELFDETMQAHLDNAIYQFNRFQNESNIGELLDESAPNLVLTKFALEGFPQFKRILCDVQWDHLAWQEAWDAGLFMAGTANGIAAMLPMMSGPGAAVGLLLEGAALVTESVRTAQRYLEYRDAFNYELASEGQLSFSEVDQLSAQYDELEERAYSALKQLIAQTAVMGLSTAVNIKSILKYKKNLAWATGVRGFKNPIRGMLAQLHETALEPFTKARFIKSWGVNKFYARFHPETRLAKPNLFKEGFRRIPFWESLDWVGESPMQLLGTRWGNSPRARLGRFGYFWAPLLVTGAYFVHSLQREKSEKLMKVITPQSHPEAFAGMRAGWLGEEDILIIANLERKLGNEKRKTVYANAKIIQEEVERSEKGTGQKDQIRIDNAYKNIAAIRAEAQAALKTIPTHKEDGKPNPDFWLVRRIENNATDMMQKWGLSVTPAKK